MTELRIEPYFGDDLFAASSYDLLLEDLREAGYEVALEQPVEQKSVEQAAVDVAIYILQAVQDHAVEALVGYLAGRLAGRSRRGRPRRVKVFGPRGEVLREVDLPDQ